LFFIFQSFFNTSLAAQLQRLAAEVFTHGYVLAIRWTMVMPIAVVVLAAASCLLVKNTVSGQDRTAEAAVEAGQMAGTISSPGSSGQNPGSTSGAGS